MANPKKNIPVLRFPEFEEEWESKKLKDEILKITEEKIAS